MSKKRYMSIFAFLFALLFAFALGFGLSACGKNKDEDDDGDKEPTTPAHTHSYVLDGDEWEWSDDFSECWNTVTCANEDGLCDKLTDTWYADVTSETTATCTEAGKTTYTATYGNDTVDTKEVDAAALGHTLQHTEAKKADCGTETDGNIEYWYCGVCRKYFSDAEAKEDSEIEKEDTVAAWAHTYTSESEGENAWHWYVSADGTTYTATVDLECSECHNTQTVDATVSGPDANGVYTGTYTFSEDVVFTDTHTPTGDEEQEPGSDHTYSVQITTTTTEYTVGATESFGAEVLCDGQEIEDAAVTWTSSNAEIATIESSTGLFTAVGEGTAVITATYTYGDGGTVTDTLTVTVSAAEDTGTSEEEQTFPLELDFNGGSFTSGQVFVAQYTTEGEGDDAVEIAPGDGKVTYSDGTETGFTAMGSANDSKVIEIKTQSNYTTLHFDGSAELTKNSIAYTLEKAGTYYIKMSYFTTTSTSKDVSGRYGVVYVVGATGSKEEVGTVADSEKTENNTNIKTRTVEITITEATTIYIGSKDSGLYFTFIGIYDGDPNESSSEEHTHEYGEPVWAWEQGEDNTWTCDTVTVNCTGCEDTAEGHTLTANVTVTSETSGAACTQQTVVYTAKATLNGAEIEDTKTESVQATMNHTYTEEFTWTPSGESFSVSVTFTCSECGTTYTDATNATVSGPDASGIYTATITDSYNNTYTDTYDPNDGIYFVSIEDYAHMTAKVGDTFTLTATVKDGHGNTVEVETSDGSITWKSEQNGSLITLAENEGTITCTAAGTAIVYAVYTDGEGKTWDSDPYYILISAAKTTPEGEQYDVKIDFSDAEGLGVGTSQTVTLDTDSTLTYVDIDLEGKVESGVLKTNSFTKYGQITYTNYILVDFSQFSGYSFELSVTFTAETTNTTMAVVNALVENEGGYGQSSSIFGDTAPDLSDEIYAATYEGSETALTYSGTVSGANATVYIVWDGTVEISSISLSLWTGDRKTVLDGSWEGIDLDFSNVSEDIRAAYNDGSIGSEGSQDVYSGKVIVDGVLTLVDWDNVNSLTGSSSYVRTGSAGLYGSGYTDYGYDWDNPGAGEVSESNPLTNYYIVSLYGLEGKTVTITVVFSTDDGEEGTMYVVTEPESLANRGSATAGYVLGSKTGKVDQKLSVAVTVPESGVLYIEYNTTMKIYSIKIEVGGKVDNTPVYNIEIDFADGATNVLYTNDEVGIDLVARITADGETISLENLTGAAIAWGYSGEGSVLTVDANGHVTVTATADATATVWATLTYGGLTLKSGSLTIYIFEATAGTGTRILIDFSDSAYGGPWGSKSDDLSKENLVLYADEEGNAIVTYIECGNYIGGWDSTGGYVCTNYAEDGSTDGATVMKGDLNNYFVIDVSDATTISITIVFTKCGANDGTLYITSEAENTVNGAPGSTVASKSTSETGDDGKVTAEFVEIDVSTLESLYIEYSVGLHIYSIDITIS